MNFNSLDMFNEKKKQQLYFSMLIVAVIFAFVIAGLVQGTIGLVNWLVKLLIEHWVKILIGIIVLLVLRKILFRRRQNVQEMRIVR